MNRYASTDMRGTQSTTGPRSGTVGLGVRILQAAEPGPWQIRSVEDEASIQTTQGGIGRSGETYVHSNDYAFPYTDSGIDTWDLIRYLFVLSPPVCEFPLWNPQSGSFPRPFICMNFGVSGVFPVGLLPFFHPFATFVGCTLHLLPR